jgi:membrane protein
MTPVTLDEPAAPEASAANQPGRAKRSWLVLKRAFWRFWDDHMNDHAGAVTYYCMLSLFPAGLLGVGLLSLIGTGDTVIQVADYLTRKGADPALVDAVRKTLDTAVKAHSGAAAVVVLAVVVALYASSGAYAAAGRALNAVFRYEEKRHWYFRRPTEAAATLALIIVAALALTLVFLGGGIANDFLGGIGLGHTARTIWGLARWPAALLLAIVFCAFVYTYAPYAPQRKFRCFSPGALIAVAIWLVASVGFSVYASNFASYNATYGAFATAVVLLVWLWLTAVALLFGAEVNAVLQSPEEPGEQPC